LARRDWILVKDYSSALGVWRSFNDGDPSPAAVLSASAVTAPEGLGHGVLLSILDSLTDGVVVADAAGRFLLFNPAAEHMLHVGALDLPLADWPAAYGCFREDGVTPFAA
jgi:PAS domain-containing protein